MTNRSYVLEKLNSDNMAEYLCIAQDILEMGQIATLALVETILNQCEHQGWRATRPPLLELLMKTESKAIQHAVIKALGWISDPVAAKVLPSPGHPTIMCTCECTKSMKNSSNCRNEAKP